MSDLAKLNRLRENAGMKPLKSWKASKDKLQEKIDDMVEAGHSDVLPGADPQVKPKIEDPEVAAARPVVKEEKVTKVRPGLGRGVESDQMGRQCREKIKDHRAAEREQDKAERKRVKLSKSDKAAIKEEAESRKGRVDPKKEPAKAKRQADHIKKKQDKRKAEGKTSTKKPKNENEVTVADIARDLDKSPKIARAKLRRHEAKLREKYPMTGERWVFPKAAEKEIREILG